MSIFDISKNISVKIAALSWFLAQIIKIAINFFEYKKLDLKLLVSSGGMPSSHSSFASSLVVTMGLQEGFDSSSFAICFAFAMVVMYDAAGVRRAAGTQAKVLNIIIENVEATGIKIDTKLKELLGHSPIEVLAGALLGVVIAFVFTP